MAEIRVQIEGSKYVAVEAGQLPPVGTRFMVHKHLSDGGTTLLLEVIEHEWRLEEGEVDSLPVFVVMVKSKRVD